MNPPVRPFMELAMALFMQPWVRPAVKLSLNLPVRLSTELFAKRSLKTLNQTEAAI